MHDIECYCCLFVAVHLWSMNKPQTAKPAPVHKKADNVTSPTLICEEMTVFMLIQW